MNWGCAQPDPARQKFPDVREATTLPKEWVVVAALEENAPPVSFGFSSPMDFYGGQIGKVDGQLRLGSHGSLAEVSGVFSVDVTDVDMGEADLTRNVQDATELLDGQRFPSINYTLEHIASAAGRVRPGETIQAVFLGQLELKGVTVPLSAPTSLTLSTGSHQRQLELEGAFQLAQLRETFLILGPGGADEPAGNRMHFTFRLLLEPKAESKKMGNVK